MMEADGTGQKQLTANAGRNYGPTVTPDGHYVVFHSDRTGVWHIWRMNRDGGNPKELVEGEWASCSADSQWVIYGDLYRVSIDGGDPVRLINKNALVGYAAISPDGKLIACEYKEQESAPWRVVIIPFAGGEPIKTLDIPVPHSIGPFFRWTNDNRQLIYVGSSNLWLRPLNGEQPTQLTNFKTQFIHSFVLSRDGRLAISRGTDTNDVVLISDLK